MEAAQIFTCNASSSVKNKLFKKDEGLFLKVEGDHITGKGHICNTDGKNGYVGDYSFYVQDVSLVTEEEYMGSTALSFVAQEKGIYGKKKVKVYLPALKDATVALGLLNRLTKNNSSNSSSASSTKRVEPVKTSSVQPLKGEPIRIVEPPKAEPAKVVEPPKAEPVRVVEPPKAEQPKAEQVKTEEVKVEQAAATQVQPVARSVYEKYKSDDEKNSITEERNKVDASIEVKADAAPAPAVEETKEMTEEEFQQRMDKLAVLKDCGLLGEKEYIAKRLELVSQLCDLSEFNERIQKLIALKDCGLLSDKEFEANRVDVIKECCDLDVEDIKEYRRNVQKLSFLEIGEVISAEEYAKSKQSLVQDIEFEANDTKERFVRKLQRLPILKECQVIEEKDYKKKLDDLFSVLNISDKDSKEVLVNKLNKWPLLLQENYIDATDLKQKQDDLAAMYLDVEWKTVDELRAIIDKMIAMKEGECLTEEQFQKRREKLLKDIDAVEDYTTRISVYQMLPQVGLISNSEYNGLKQKCIDDIFVRSNSVAEFKVRANNLVELQKIGMLTSEEFANYKTKLMSEL